jgi:CDP-diacylglycerol--glycerol-3-phosphate 3-phosphatidyltransferase
VTLLCDALRTTRSSQDSSIDTSSAAMLARVLLSEDASWRKKTWGRSQEQLRIALYHTPQLTETLRWMLPARAREIVGVCHLKAFIFDNTLVLSGANLSTSYFTHRQDRYLCFLNCNQLASHFCSLINIVASFSYTLDMEGKLKPCSVHFDPVREPASFWSEMALSVTELFLPTSEPTVDKGFDTWVFPTVQMGPLGIRQDEEVLLWLLKQMPKGTDIHLSSPYFNLTPAYEAALLEAANDKNVHILTASPKVCYLAVICRCCLMLPSLNPLPP